MASVLEAKATEKQVNWPAAIAPFDIHICPIDYTKKENIKEIADNLYAKLKEQGYDVLLDDRNKNPGVKFADSDLIGAPIRIVVSPRNIENSKLEVKVIGEEEASLVDIKEIYEFVQEKTKGWLK
jgi:prolyl-tRNA synthetase